VFQLPKFAIVVWVRKTANYQATHDEIPAAARKVSARQVDRVGNISENLIPQMDQNGGW